MSNLDRLLAKGAESCGGDLILRHQVMGKFRSGDFFVTELGLLELEVLDMELPVELPVEPPVEPKAPRSKKQTPALADDVALDV